MKKLYIAFTALFLVQFTFSQSTLYSEDFTGQNGKGIIGAAFGGSNTDLSGVDWTIDVSAASIGANFFGGNEDYFYVNNESFSAKDTDGNAYWFSPSINIAGYSNVSFSFDASTSGNNDNSDTFLTEYRINGGAWLTAATNGNLNNDFNLVVSQTGLSGSSIELRIRVNTNADNEITTFDNILVQGTPPPCSSISGLTIDSFTATSANISWTAGGTEAGWEIVVQTAGTGIPAGSGTDVATNSYSDNTLNGSTDYEVYVRADCSNTSDGFSVWAGPANFTTPLRSPQGVTCSAGSSSYIYTENFESNPPSGWTGTGFNGSNGNWDITTANNNSGQTGPLNAFDNGGGSHLEYEASGNSSATASAISPAIDLTSVVDGAELSFYLHAYGSAMGTLNVGVSNSASGPFNTIFTQDGQLQSTAGAAWIPVGISLNAYIGQTIYIEFSNTGSGSSYQGDMSIDFLRVEACEPCPSPNNLVASNITATSADISWDAGGSETDWEIVIQAAGTGFPAGTGTPVTTNSFASNALNSITAYEVYVRADCDIDGFSGWAGPLNFTTLLANDNFADAIPISCGNTYNGDTTSATIDEAGAPDVSTVNPDTDTDNDSPNVWYQFIGTGNPVTLSTCANSSYDTEIIVFTGTSGNLTNIAEGYDECSNVTYEAEVTFNSVFGTVYSISIEGWNSGDTGAFELSVTCATPSSITYTYTNGSWDGNGNPDGVSTINDDIIITSGDATISTNTTANSVTVNPGAGLIIDSAVTLTTANGVLLESSSTSYSSLILDGTVSGDMVYERHVNMNGSGSTGDNDLISAPLTGQPFNTFAAANPNILDNNAGTLYLFGPFEKNTGQFVTWSNTETATLDPGVGYRAASDDNGSFTFTGTAINGVVTNDIVNSGTNNAEWNLVGNPYPSYLNVHDFLLHDVGGVTNIQLFDAPTAAIYGYDGSALNGWTIYNLATTSSSTVIAPGQGFFVSADATNTGPYNLEFTPAMRSTGNSDDFIQGRTAELIYIKLGLSSNDNTARTDFYFNPNASQGLDVGYDAKTFYDATSQFNLYSHLVQDNEGESMALQALNASDVADVSIPLGVHTNQGEQITFSITDSTLPEGVNVYLEDVVKNTITLLNTSDYVITPNSDLLGTGRFFLRFSEDALSTSANSFEDIQIYATKSPRALFVKGQLSSDTNINIYDIQGRLISNTILDHNNTSHQIDLSNVISGIYLVTLDNGVQQRSVKVIIN